LTGILFSADIGANDTKCHHSLCLKIEFFDSSKAGRKGILRDKTALEEQCFTSSIAKAALTIDHLQVAAPLRAWSGTTLTDGKYASHMEVSR
jgi:hypothetical protein